MQPCKGALVGVARQRPLVGTRPNAPVLAPEKAGNTARAPSPLVEGLVLRSERFEAALETGGLIDPYLEASPRP